MDDRETRFDEIDLTKLTVVQLEEYMAGLRDRREAVGDPFVQRSYALRMAEVGRAQSVLAIRNRRETERQDALPPVDAEVDPCV